MPGYVTFLLDLAGTGDVRIVDKSLRLAPDQNLRPANAFIWKVTCNRRGEVGIRAKQGKHLRDAIAIATWNGGLELKRQAGRVPTRFQWQLVEMAVSEALAQAAAERAKVATSLTADERTRSGDGEDAEDLTQEERSHLQPTNDDETTGLEALAQAELVAHKKARAARTEQTKHRAGIAVGVIIALVISAAIAIPVAWSIRARGKAVVPVTMPAAFVAPHADAQGFDAPPEVAIADAPDGKVALAIALPVMKSAGGGDSAWLLVRYRKWQWADVDGPAETTVALVEKDAEPEIGKRLCAEGSIDKIERRDVSERKTFVGTLRTDTGDHIAFTAVGSTGDLVKRSRAKFCGIVTGKIRTDAALFGLFDLPETRTPQVEQ